MLPHVLSLQSAVVYGHVGNSAAGFALQRLGCAVLAVPSVILSSHTGYPGWRGRVQSGDEVAALFAGLTTLEEQITVDTVLSGYLGSVAIGARLAAHIAHLRKEQPALPYVCDPVMGDTGPGLFVEPALVPMFRDVLVPLASVVTPNVFELGLLSGALPDNRAMIERQAHGLRARGPDYVLVTSVGAEATAAARIGVLVCGPEGAALVTTPRLALRLNGAGDLFTALVTGWCARGLAIHGAVERALNALYAVAGATAAAGGGELQLIACQDALLDPPAAVHWH